MTHKPTEKGIIWDFETSAYIAHSLRPDGQWIYKEDAVKFLEKAVHRECLKAKLEVLEDKLGAIHKLTAIQLAMFEHESILQAEIDKLKGELNGV